MWTSIDMYLPIFIYMMNVRCCSSCGLCVVLFGWWKPVFDRWIMAKWSAHWSMLWVANDVCEMQGSRFWTHALSHEAISGWLVFSMQLVHGDMFPCLLHIKLWLTIFTWLIYNGFGFRFNLCLDQSGHGILWNIYVMQTAFVHYWGHLGRIWF